MRLIPEGWDTIDWSYTPGERTILDDLLNGVSGTDDLPIVTRAIYEFGKVTRYIHLADIERTFVLLGLPFTICAVHSDNLRDGWHSRLPQHGNREIPWVGYVLSYDREIGLEAFYENRGTTWRTNLEKLKAQTGVPVPGRGARRRNEGQRFVGRLF